MICYNYLYLLGEPFFRQIPVLGYYANSADPVQMPPNGASYQGLHCLLAEISMENAVEIKTSTVNH